MDQSAPTTSFTTPSGVVVSLNADQSVNSLKDSSGNEIPTPAGQSINNSRTNSPTPGSPSLIVTSAASRAQYANNVGNMNTAIGNVSTPPPVTTSSNGNSTQADSGVNTARQNGGTYQGQDGNSYYKYDGSPADNAPVPVTTDVTGAQGNANTNNNQTSPDKSITNGLDPVIAKQYTDTISNLDSTLQQRQSDLNAAKATVQNDPAASAALDAIKQKYDVLVKAMQDKNKMVLGGYQTNQARSGAMQFANDMSSNFMSAEMDRANGRVADLVAKEQDLLLKTTIAYKTGDVKALNAAQNAYDKANTDKLKAIGDLVKATNDHTKSVQAQAKIDQAQAKADLQEKQQRFVSMNNYAKTSADGISQATSGMTPDKKKQFIDAFVQQTASSMGLSQDEATQFQGMIEGTSTKSGTSQANTADIISNRDANTDLKTTNTADTIKNRDAGTKIKQQNANTSSYRATHKSSTSPTTNTTKFDKPTTTALYGTGLSGAETKILGQAIYKYGAQTVIDNPKLNDSAKTILENLYGLTRKK